MATTITLSTLALGFSAINTLIIRDAAIDAAQRSALAEGHGQTEYLMQMLDERLPSLARYEIQDLSNSGYAGYSVTAQLPGLGLVPFAQSQVKVSVTREALS
jgi:hypothetical protein